MCGTHMGSSVACEIALITRTGIFLHCREMVALSVESPVLDTCGF